MEDHPFPREINAALKAAIQKWASTHKTPFLIAQNVDNFQSAKTNIANCIMKSSISNTSVVPINYFFDFDEFDSRANTVEAMMSTLFTQSTWELEEDALSACTSTLSNQRLGWNKTDRFNVYYRTILTRSDVEISWIFANLNENIESYSWLLEILSTVATRCDFHFRVVFLNRNFQDFALDAEYVTVINWANPETTLTLALATMDQQSLDSINDVSGRGNTDLQLSFEAAELSALQVIEKNTRIGFLGPKLIDLFHKSEVSYEHKKMIGIWASYYHTPDDADIIRSHLSSSLEPNLDTTFQLILDAAVPGPWSSASAIETLELIALSFRSLTYNELGDLEEAYKELKPHQKPRPTGSAAILSWLPGILDLHGREVHLSHSGFRQFLFSQNGERLYLSEKEMARSQSRLALLCLEYLLSSHGRGLLESAAAGARDIGAPDPRMGFVSYAVSHWPKHAQLAGVHLLLEANPVNRFLAEQAMLDTWTKVYWKYSSKPIHLNLDRLSPLAIFAEHGLDTLLIALIEKYEGTDWLAEQLTNAFVVAARNGMTNTVRLLFERQSIGPNTSTLLIQASLQSGDKNTLSFAISKALHIADPWECFSVTVCQALAAGQHGVAVTMLSHSPWHKLENKKKKEMLMAASEGGDAQSLDFILDKCEGLLCEEDIFYATLEATGNGYATVSASLFGKLLKMVNTRNDTEHKLKNGVIESSKSPEQNFGKQLTTHLRGATVAEPPSDIRNSEPKAEEGIVVVDAQETSAEVNTDPASGTSTKELNAGSTYGVRVLEFAIQKGQYDVIQAVMDVLCETKTCISSAQTLLENAITLCRPRCFNALLLAFSHANAPLQDCAIFDKKELLIYALRRGSGNFVQGLLSNGAVLDETMFEHVFDNDLLDDDAKSELVGLVIDEARKTIKESALVEVLTRQLVTALKLNAYGAAKRLIQAGANVNTRDVHGTRTPLYHAVYCGDVKMVEALLEAEADVNIAEDDDSRWLPIHAGYDNVEILKLLLAAGADVNATFEGGGTVLYLASKWGLHECVEEILKHKPNLDDGTPMVYSAVCNGHEAIVSMLLNAGANPLHPATADHNECLLHACTEKNYVDILNRLLLFNFDLEHKDKYGRTALNCRNTANNIPALRALIRRGAQIDTKDQPWNDTPLSNAVREGDVALAEFFISEGADVNINIDRGLENTPLLSACAISSLAMVKMLIKNGANTSVVSVGVPGTLFQAACLNQTDAQPEILSYLLENELADVHQASKWWGGNLNTACLMADINVVDLLIGRGADVSLRDKIGRWPVQFALYRSVEFVKRLCNRGPDQSSAQLLVKDAMQRNALHFAVVSGRLDLVRYVITQQKGLAKEKDCDGWTPLFWAARKCYKWDTQTSERAQIIQELLNDGADIMSMAEGVNRTWTPYTLARYHGLEDDVIALLRPTEDQISNSKHRMFWQESISARAKVAKYDDGAYCDICLMVSFPTHWMKSSPILTLSAGSSRNILRLYRVSEICDLFQVLPLQGFSARQTPIRSEA